MGAVSRAPPPAHTANTVRGGGRGAGGAQASLATGALASQSVGQDGNLKDALAGVEDSEFLCPELR